MFGIKATTSVNSFEQNGFSFCDSEKKRFIFSRISSDTDHHAGRCKYAFPFTRTRCRRNSTHTYARSAPRLSYTWAHRFYPEFRSTHMKNEQEIWRSMQIKLKRYCLQVVSGRTVKAFNTWTLLRIPWCSGRLSSWPSPILVEFHLFRSLPQLPLYHKYYSSRVEVPPSLSVLRCADVPLWDSLIDNCLCCHTLRK